MPDANDRGRGEDAAVERREDVDESGSGKASGSRVQRAATVAGLAAGSFAVLAGGVMPDAPRAQAERLPEPRTPEEAAAKAVSWDLTVTDHERVDFFVEFLMRKNHDKTRLWLERIGKYGPLIRSELRARGMPEDLLYLTMIESGFDPNAYSRAHAAGLWQFIEETGERYGLEVTRYVDERRDPVKATAAALTYLSEMHERFGSWYLSAAGYNTGENRVGRIMREVTGGELGDDAKYWEIWDRLPRETRDYVPLMLAAGRIAKEPHKHGFHGLDMQEPLAFEEVVVDGGTQLDEVARAGGVDGEAVRALNPHLVRGMTPPGRRMEVRVPPGRAAVVAANLGGQASVGGVYYAE